MKNPYRSTMYACFTGYVVQAIVNNFIPLLFVTFQQSYGISLSRITFLITFNFGVQLAVDLLSAGLIDRIGYVPAFWPPICSAPQDCSFLPSCLKSCRIPLRAFSSP